MIDFTQIFRRHKNERKLCYSTDIHSHVCPGIDDGAKDIVTATNLIREMSKLGITHMIVTPHVTDEIFPNTQSSIETSFDKLSQSIKEEGINMKLSYSAEYRIDNLFLQLLDSNRLLPLPNNYILIENSWYQELRDLDNIIYKIKSEHHYHPILAHPERYPYYQSDRNRYYELHAKGVLFQINLLSLAGYYDKASQSTAEWLLDHDMIDLVGSDLHQPKQIEAITGYINSKRYDKLLKKQHLIQNDNIFII